jgi:hypothetical protein
VVKELVTVKRVRSKPSKLTRNRGRQNHPGSKPPGIGVRNQNEHVLAVLAVDGGQLPDLFAPRARGMRNSRSAPRHLIEDITDACYTLIS